jgi:hypothetical protein
MKKSFLIFSLISAIFLTSGVVVLAQNENLVPLPTGRNYNNLLDITPGVNQGGGSSGNWFSDNSGSINIRNIDDILRIISNISKWMYNIILVLVVVFILLAAFTFLTAGEKTENVKKAKHQIYYAVLALVVAIIAFSISTIIQNLLKGR